MCVGAAMHISSRDANSHPPSWNRARASARISDGNQQCLGCGSQLFGIGSETSSSCSRWLSAATAGQMTAETANGGSLCGKTCGSYATCWLRTTQRLVPGVEIGATNSNSAQRSARDATRTFLGIKARCAHAASRNEPWGNARGRVRRGVS